MTSIEWHTLPDRPCPGEQVILEVVTVHDAAHRVGHGLCRDRVWDFHNNRFTTAVHDDEVIRWARYPEASDKAPGVRYTALVRYPPFLPDAGQGRTLEEALAMLGASLDFSIEIANGTQPIHEASQGRFATAKLFGEVGGTLTLDVFAERLT